MRAHPAQLLVFLLLLVLGSGCTGSPQNPLLGGWILDTEGMKETPEYKNASDAERAQLTTMLGMMQAEVTFTETEMQRSMTLMGQTQEEVEPYTIEEADGGQWKISTTDDAGETSVAMAKIQGDRLEVTTGGDTLVFKRK